MSNHTAYAPAYTPIFGTKPANMYHCDGYVWLCSVSYVTMPLTYARQQHIIYMRDNRGAHELGDHTANHSIKRLDPKNCNPSSRPAISLRRQTTKGEATQNEVALHLSSQQDRGNERGANYREGQQFLGDIPKNAFDPPRLWRAGGP